MTFTNRLLTPLLFSALLGSMALLGACSPPDNNAFCDESMPCGTGEVCNLMANACEAAVDAGIEVDATPVVLCEGNNQCVAEIPIDWIGPLVYTTADTEEELPACPSEYADEVGVLGNEIATSVDCECSCGTVSNPTCTDARMVPSGGANGQICQSTVCSNGGCPTTVEVPAGSFRGVAEFRGEPAQFLAGALNGGTCTSPSGPSTLSSNFGSKSRLCQTTTVDAKCGQNQSCAPATPSEFSGQHCIAQQGELECPTDGNYTDRQILYASINDQRECDKSSCSCEVEGSCGGAMRYGNLLSNPITVDLTSSGCPDIPDINSMFFQYLRNPTPDCRLLGAAVVTGNATPTGATTLCCEPVQ